MRNPLSIRRLTTPAAVAVLLLCAGCSSPYSTAADHYAKFGQAFAAGNYLYARYEILQAVRYRDDVPVYWLALARTQLALRQFGGAYQAYSRAYELDKSSVEALQNLAEISLVINRLPDAERHTDAILAINPSDVRARLVKGHIALRRRNFEEANRWADDLLTTYPLEDAPLTLKARILFDSGKPAEGIGLLERAIPVAGATPQKLDMLLDLYKRLGDQAAVERTLQRYVEAVPDNPNIKLRYAEQLFRNGKEAGAETLISQVIATSSSRQLAETAANAMIGPGARYTSEEDLARLAEGTTPAVKAALARAALELGHYQLAARMMEPFINGELNASTATAIGLYASAQQGLGNEDEALELAQKVLEFDRTNPRALEVRGTLAFKRNDLSQALSDARVLVADQPRNADHRILLAQVQAARGNKTLADQAWRQAFNDMPGNERILTGYLTFLGEAKFNEQAVDVAREFTGKYPRSQAGWKGLAEACERIGDSDCANGARTAVRRVEMIQGRPDSRA